MFKAIFSKKGVSVIEVLVVIVVLSTGILSVYDMLNSGQKLVTASENRIIAINIGREGIEAVQNIRDTNWLRFSADNNNCWDVSGYDQNCIGGTGGVSLIDNSATYVLTNNTAETNNPWQLITHENINNTSNTNPAKENLGSVYRDNVGRNIQYDPNDTATRPNKRICAYGQATNCRTRFSRFINILEDTADPNKMVVQVRVLWFDNTKSGIHALMFQTDLKNWKKFDL